MKIRVLTIIFVLNIAAAGSFAESVSSLHPKSDGLGRVHFDNSCSPQVRTEFNRAVAMLHSFQYGLAERTFTHIIQRDSQCAIAYWGAAMALNHQLWDVPSTDDLIRGSAYLNKAAQVEKRSTQRERDYLNAARAFFQSEHQGTSRYQAYSDAMDKLHRRYPGDTDATAFYALSLLALPSEGADDSKQKHAIEILQKLFTAEPQHPGAAHYLIHATDTAENAQLGLAAARTYSKIAPASPHALHMPAHIFARLGMWQESIESNLASIAAAKEATDSGYDDGAGDALHAMMYLSYSYLQSGDDESARQVAESIKDLPKARTNDVANNSAILEALYTVETHDWQQAAKLSSEPSTFPFARVRTYWARAIGAARTGDIAAARQNIEKLDQSRSSMLGHMQNVGCQMHTGRSIDPVSVQQLEARAWLAWAEGKSTEALELMRKAAEKEDGYGVESRTVPAYEMLGDLMLELQQPESALVAYEAALKEAPVRLNSLAGAARASRAMGNLEGARSYYAAFVKCCIPTAARKELEEAKLFMAGN